MLIELGSGVVLHLSELYSVLRILGCSGVERMSLTICTFKASFSALSQQTLRMSIKQSRFRSSFCFLKSWLAGVKGLVIDLAVILKCTSPLGATQVRDPRREDAHAIMIRCLCFSCTCLQNHIACIGEGAF